MKHKKYIGFGKRPIHTTCNCGKSVELIDIGNFHTANCSCGRNVRTKGGTLIIDFSKTIKL